MKNSTDLGGCYPPRPSASVDNTFLDLQNSSYPTQPHSIIAKYLVCFVRPFPPLLEICVTTSTIIYYCNFTLIIWKHVYLKKAGLASRNIVLNIRRCVSLAVVYLSSFHFSTLAD